VWPNVDALVVGHIRPPLVVLLVVLPEVHDLDVHLRAGDRVAGRCRIAREVGSMKPSSPNRRQLLQMGAAVGSLLEGDKALALEPNPRKLAEPLGPMANGRRSKRPSAGGASRRRRTRTRAPHPSTTPLAPSLRRRCNSTATIQDYLRSILRPIVW